MTSQSLKTLGLFKKPGLFDKGLGALLPQAYKKFYKEWKETQPTAVHYIPEEGMFKRDDITGEVHPIQDNPIPVLYPREHNQHIWGGEGIIQGFQCRSRNKRRVPHFWVPILKRSVVYSEVLNEYISVIVTDRTLNLINDHFGFDHYLLKTPACDLKALLPLAIKRKILQALEQGCPAYANSPEKQNKIVQKYQKYLSAYSSEEIKWYGYSFTEACRILQESLDQKAAAEIVPLKHIYRAQLIQKLKNNELDLQSSGLDETKTGSWLQKINPFSKKHET
ncbi:39S ribosomal protein L28, mitochondrial [Aethina tumida]|uniref:39S ribosomal protein L28, mitochondrial n=1 Tax=Aethina tumida TaxID=116153 RepID=UPI00096AE9AD|nr:39S ribosomal protein L28, mitochondrial [Aethina tumida]